MTAVVVVVLGLTRQRQARRQLVFRESEQAQKCARMQLHLAHRFMGINDQRNKELTGTSSQLL